jgi:hypothetical protein
VPSAPRPAIARTARRCAVAASLAFGLCAPAVAGPESTVRSGSVAAADFGDARIEGQVYGFGLRWPLEAKGFEWGLDYAYTRFEYEGLATRNRDLHRLAVPLVWRRASAWARSLELRPVIATSSNVFKDFVSRGSGEDLQLHGRWLTERRGHGWGWRAGLARDDTFGKLRIYPVVAALRAGPAWTLEIGWPETRVLRRAGRQLELGVAVAPAGGRWHVVSDERDGADFNYELRAWRSAATASWGGASGWRLAASAGLEFDRRHRLEDDLGSRVDRAAGDASFFDVSLAYRW